MILDSIELENIRSYNKEKIEFPKGITLFEGDIGSGKSSVLMAIEFALFGLGSQKPEALLAKKTDTGSVLLRFASDNHSYEIKRVLKRNLKSVSQDASGSYIIEDDIKEELAPSELKQRVLQILKFNEPTDPKAGSRIFRYAVFTPQDEMKIVLQDAKNRLETIRKAFGIEDYKTASDNADVVVTSLEKQMELFKVRFSNLDKLEVSVKESKKMIVNITSDIERLISEREKYDIKKESIESELKKLQEKNMEKIELKTIKKNLELNIENKKLDLDSIENSISEKNTRIEKITSSITRYDKLEKPTQMEITQIDKEIKKFQDINNKITTAKIQFNVSNQDVIKLEDKLGNNKNNDLNELKKKETESKEMFSYTRNKLKETEKKTQAIHDEITKNQTSQNNLENKSERITKLGSKCPYCESKITDEHLEKLKNVQNKELEQIKKNLDKHNTEKHMLQSIMEKLEQDVTKYDNDIKIYSELIVNLQEYILKSNKLKEIKIEIENLEKQNHIIKEKDKSHTENPIEYLLKLRSNLVEYTNSQKRVKDMKENQQTFENDLKKYRDEMSTIKNNITTSEKKLQDVLKKIESFSDIDANIAKYGLDLNSIQQNISDNISKLATNDQKRKNENEKLERCELEIFEAKKWKALYKKYRNYHDWITDFFIPTIGVVEKQVLVSIQQNFNEIYRRLYSMLMEDVDKESRIDESFTPIIEQDGYEQDISYLSGGEKTSIALAYRLTLNSLMRKETESMKSNLLILDEPTDGFSKTQLSKVQDLLEDLKSEQIILVSHEKDLESYVNNVFYISKNDGISKVRRMNN